MGRIYNHLHMGSIALTLSPQCEGRLISVAKAFTLALDYRALLITEEEAEDLAEKMLASAKRFEIEELRSLKGFLLPSGHERLVRELERKKEAVQSEKHTTSFVEFHQSFFRSKGMCWSKLNVPEEVSQSPWFALCPRREKDVLAYALASTPEMITVDISARLDRASVSTSLPLQCLTASSKLYLWKAPMGSGDAMVFNRLLLGWEALAMQGYPPRILEALQDSAPTDTQMCDLAGNAFSATSILAVLLGIVLHFPFDASSGTEPASPESDDMPSVLAMFARRP